MKTPVRLGRLYIWRYLHAWDVASIARRDEIIDKFIEDYTTVEAIDTDYLFSQAGGLLFTRFTVGMQMAFARRKPVWYYFQALGIFVKSLQAERYIVEFTLMGALISTFEVLRVDEMKDRDKSYVFQFLIRMVEGCGGTRVKEFICSDTSYLESVVDCLTMCKNRTVIHNARLFLENMCQGNTTPNISRVSKYVISLLPCDFNPPVQALACRVLPIIIHQNPDIAGNCYSLVVDALKTDYNEMLVDIGEACLAIMETSFADDLLTALMEYALPSNISDNLENRGASNMGLLDQVTAAPTKSSMTESRMMKAGGDGQSVNVKANYVTHDTYYRQQYGALYTLDFMLRNKPKLVDWMVSKGIVGSVLGAMGTAPYADVQLAGVRLLILVHELSPDCVAALSLLVPTKLLVILLSEVESALQYLTSPMCVSLLRIGRAVQSNWKDWYEATVIPKIKRLGDASAVSLPPDMPPAIAEVQTDCDTLAELTSQGLLTMAESMPIMHLDDEYRNHLMNKTGANLSIVSVPRFITTPVEEGVAQIQADPELEGFRKYLPKTEGSAMDDGFEKFGIGDFTLDDDEEHNDDAGGGMTDIEAAKLEDALKAMDETAGPEEGDEDNEEDGEGEGDEDDGTYLFPTDPPPTSNNVESPAPNEDTGPSKTGGNAEKAPPEESS